MAKYFVIRDPRTCPKNYNNEPTVEYSSLPAARKEAARLASRDTSCKFYIVKAIKYIFAHIQVEEENVNR